MSSGHVVIWKLPSSMAGDDVDALNSFLGELQGGGESAAADIEEGDEGVDFVPALPVQLPRVSDVAEPEVKQQQKQPVSASVSTSAADSDGGDSLDGDTPW
jgi:hypothetical protein